ncbi:MAG: hypothetical protein ACW99G_15265 [Candidatus Thorarchaeota archaeon]|jgi:hypothetical protein
MPKTIVKQFNAEQFTPTQFDTAEQKAKFANHFVKFVESGFKREKFPKWFYTRLSMTFGHIAHYNLDGFYAQWFTTTERQMEFLNHTLNHPCYGQPEYTYSDVEKEIIEWLKGRLAL